MSEEKEDQKDDRKKIVYVGTDLNFWRMIQTRILNQYVVNDDKEKAQEEKDKTLDDRDHGKFLFADFNDNDLENLYPVFVELAEIDPDIIYIDLSAIHVEKYLELLNLISNDHILGEKQLVGLVEDKEKLHEYSRTAVNFIHIKSAEHHDVVYDPFKILYPNEVKTPDYARALFKQDAILDGSMKVKSLTKKSVEIEGDLVIVPTQTVELQLDIPERIVPSKRFTQTKSQEINLSTNHQYLYEFSYVLVDPPELVVPTEETPEEAGSTEEGEENTPSEEEEKKFISPERAKEINDQKQEDYKERMERCQRELEEWIDDRAVGSRESLKVMIVDGDMTLLKNTERSLAAFPHKLFYKRSIKDSLKEISKYRPQFIAYQFPDVILPDEPEEEIVEEEKKVEVDGIEVITEEKSLEEEKAEEEAAEQEEDQEEEEEEKERVFTNLELAWIEFESIIRYIKTFDDYHPFIILFNNNGPSVKTLTNRYGYEQILSDVKNVDLGFIDDCASLYIKKSEAKLEAALRSKIKKLKASDPAKYRKLTMSDLMPPKYYISDDSPLRRAKFEHDIKLMGMTESEMKFRTSTELTIGRPYGINFPVPLKVTLFLPKDGKIPFVDGVYEYQGLINGIDEIDKQKIRQFVNKIFFAALEDKRRQEAEQQEKIKQEAQEKMNEPNEEEGEESQDEAESGEE